MERLEKQLEVQSSIIEASRVSQAGPRGDRIIGRKVLHVGSLPLGGLGGCPPPPRGNLDAFRLLPGLEIKLLSMKKKKKSTLGGGRGRIPGHRLKL